jgi:hypothetical protein
MALNLKTRFTLFLSILPLLIFASGGEVIPYLFTNILLLLIILITPWVKLNTKGSLILISTGIAFILVGHFVTWDLPFNNNHKKILFSTQILPVAGFVATYIWLLTKSRKFKS